MPLDGLGLRLLAVARVAVAVGVRRPILVNVGIATVVGAGRVVGSGALRGRFRGRRLASGM